MFKDRIFNIMNSRKICPPEIYSPKYSISKSAIVKNCTFEISPFQVARLEIAASELTTDEVGTTKVKVIQYFIMKGKLHCIASSHFTAGFKASLKGIYRCNGLYNDVNRS